MSGLAAAHKRRRRGSSTEPADPEDEPVFVASGSSDGAGDSGRARSGSGSDLSLGNVVAAGAQGGGGAFGGGRPSPVGVAGAAASAPPTAPAPPTHAEAMPQPVTATPADEGPCEMEGGAGPGAPPSQWVASGGATGAFPPDPRVTLLFDLNGVLLVNPRAPGGGPRVARLRPHVGPALARLAGAFRLGVYSSATTPTVNKALAPVTAAVRLALLQAGGDGSGGRGGDGVAAAAAAAPRAKPPRIFELVLCRKYCRPAPADHVASSGKEWDTVKPLALHFGGPESLARTILVDNDAHKALPAEAGNMVLVPTWHGPPPLPPPAEGAAAGPAPPPDPDNVLLHLVDALLDPASGLTGPGDVRTRTAGVAARVAAAAALTAAGLGAHVPRLAAQAQDSLQRPGALADRPTSSGRVPNPASGGAGAAPGVDTPPLPSSQPLPDERSAWATAVAAAVSELGAAAAAPLGTIWAYARFRAPGSTVQAVLNKQAVKEAVAALRAGGEGAAIVAATKPPDTRVLAAKHLKQCYSLSQAGSRRLPEGGVTAAVDRLRAAVAAAGSPGGAKGGGTPQPKRKRNSGSGRGDPVTVAVEDVVLACIADLTADGRAPNITAVLKYLQDTYGRPTFAKAATARAELLARLEEQMVVEVVSYGHRTPQSVQGLRCLAVPTAAEVDAALMMLLEYKRRAQQPTLPIAGTLASDDDGSESDGDFSVGQPTPAPDSFAAPPPHAVQPGPPPALVDMAAPLPVYEDRGGSGDAVLSAPRDESVGLAPGLPGPYMAVSAHPPHGGAPFAPHAGAGEGPGLAGRPALGANWWEARAAAGAPGNEWQAAGSGDALGGAGGPPAAQPPPPPPPVVVAPPAPPAPAFTDLHHEVLAFADRAAATEAEARTVRESVDAIRRLASGLWPASQTILFGSQATGLALPGSDLDVVILGASDELENPAQGFSWDQRQALGDRLRALLKAMRKAGLVAGKAVVIKARVPIIKCDLRAGVAVDISLGAANGAAAVRFIQKQVATVPALRPLILVVKAVLKEAGLNEVFSGGLSSYSTTLMVVAHLQAEGLAPPTPAAVEDEEDEAQAAPPPPAPPPTDVGRLLWSFFHRFGRRFDYARQAVRVSAGGIVAKPADWVRPERPFSLAVEDPQEAGKDIGSGSYNIAAVATCFRRAADKLAAAVNGGGAGGPRRGGAPIEFRADAGAAREAAAWAAIQADSASRGAPYHAHAAAEAAAAARRVTPLNQIMDVEAAAARSGGGGRGGGQAAAVAARSPARQGRAAAARSAALHHTRAPPPRAGGGGGGGPLRARRGSGGGGGGPPPFHARSLANQVAAATTPGPLHGGGGRGGGGGGGGGKWAKARAAKHAAAGGGGVQKPVRKMVLAGDGSGAKPGSRQWPGKGGRRR